MYVQSQYYHFYAKLTLKADTLVVHIRWLLKRFTKMLKASYNALQVLLDVKG